MGCPSQHVSSLRPVPQNEAFRRSPPILVLCRWVSHELCLNDRSYLSKTYIASFLGTPRLWFMTASPVIMLSVCSQDLQMEASSCQPVCARDRSVKTTFEDMGEETVFPDFRFQCAQPCRVTVKTICVLRAWLRYHLPWGLIPTTASPLFPN